MSRTTSRPVPSAPRRSTAAVSVRPRRIRRPSRYTVVLPSAVKPRTWNPSSVPAICVAPLTFRASLRRSASWSGHQRLGHDLNGERRLEQRRTRSSWRSSWPAEAGSRSPDALTASCTPPTRRVMRSGGATADVDGDAGDLEERLPHIEGVATGSHHGEGERAAGVGRHTSGVTHRSGMQGDRALQARRRRTHDRAVPVSRTAVWAAAPVATTSASTMDGVRTAGRMSDTARPRRRHARSRIFGGAPAIRPSISPAQVAIARRIVARRRRVADRPRRSLIFRDPRRLRSHRIDVLGRRGGGATASDSLPPPMHESRHREARTEQRRRPAEPASHRTSRSAG